MLDFNVYKALHMQLEKRQNDSLDSNSKADASKVVDYRKIKQTRKRLHATKRKDLVSKSGGAADGVD